LPPPIVATAAAPVQSQQAARASAVRVSLTVEELRQRQALRVEGDRLQLSRLMPSEALRSRLVDYLARLEEGQRALDAYRTSEAGAWSYAQGRAVDKGQEAEAMRQRLIDAEPEALKAKRRAAVATLRADDAELARISALKKDLRGSRGEGLYDADRAMWDRLYNAEPASWQNTAPTAPEFLSLSEPYYTLGARTLSEQVSRQTDRLANIGKTISRLERSPAGVAAQSQGQAAGGPAEAELRRAELLLERKWAEQNLAELKRVEAQRGGRSSAPVVLGVWTPTSASSGAGLLFPS
jgi:hypothetical protein